MRFSIIVPVYNVENYVGKCINSILTQTYQDFELIIVNDGSTDNSATIINDYGTDFSDKITIINQENKGPGGARNTGIEYAHGEYLVFIDGDDYIENTMLCVLDNYINEKAYDIIIFNAYRVYGKDNKVEKYDLCEGLSGELTVKNNHKILLIPPAPWNKIYKREFFINTHIRYPERMLYEDLAITRNLMEKAGSIFFFDKNLYYYVQRNESTMHMKISDRMKDIMKANTIMINDFRKRGIYEQYYEELEYIAVRSVLIVILKNILIYDYKNKMGNEFVDFVNENFPNCLNNKYFSEKEKKECSMLMRYQFKKYYIKYCQKDRMKLIIKRMVPKQVIKIYRKLRG